MNPTCAVLIPMTQMIALLIAARIQPSQHLLPNQNRRENGKHTREVVEPQHDEKYLHDSFSATLRRIAL